MIKVPLNIYDYDDVMDLFIEMLKDSPYYVYNFPNKATREKRMREICGRNIRNILENCGDEVVGIFGDLRKNENGNYQRGELIAFILPFTYRVGPINNESMFELKRRDLFFQPDNFVHRELVKYNSLVSYLISVVERKGYEDLELGFQLIKEQIERFPNWTCVTDTTNERYIKWFKENGFIIKEWDDGVKNHVLAIHPSKQNS